MTSKRKNTSQASPRKYTTREIMEITEQRRAKDDAARRPLEVKSQRSTSNSPLERINSKIEPEAVKLHKLPQLEQVKAIPTRVPNLIQARLGPVTLIMWGVAFLLMFYSKYSAIWIGGLSAKLNTLIVGVSVFLLKILQGSCSMDGLVLNANYYKLSLQGDLTALYALELLIVFAVLFAYFQKTTRQKRGIVFAALIPLGILANVLRVLWACGLALNEGVKAADRFFHGILMGFVFIFIILGLIILESFSSSE